MGKQQWSPPSTDTPQSTWTPPSSDVLLKKKESDSSPSSDGSQDGIPQYLATSQSSGQDGASSTLAQGAADLNTIESGNTPDDDAGTGGPSKTDDSNSLVDLNNNQHKAGWSPTSIAGSIDAAFAKPLDDVGTIFDFINSANNATSSLPTKDANGNPIDNSSVGGKLFHWAANYMQSLGDKAPLPNGFAGDVVKGITGVVPAIAATYATGGGNLEAMAAGDLAANSQSKLGLLQNALTKASGPLTQYIATTKTIEGASDAYKSSGGDLGQTALGAVGGFNEGVISGGSLELQMAAGGQVGQTLFNGALKSGIVNADGVLTEQALKSFIGSPAAFAAGSVAQDLYNGRPINWENAGVSAATALPFEAPHVFEAYNQSGDIKAAKNELNAQVNQAVAIRDNNAIVNFSQAAPQDIFNAMQKPETSQDLQLQALQKGIDAQNSDDYKTKNTLHLQQVELQKQSDIKRLGETVINQGVDGFVQAVNHTELPEDIKTTLLNNANAINSVYNPVELQKTDLGKTISGLTDQIQQVQQSPIVDANNPTVATDNLVQLNDLIGQKIKAQSDLFDLSFQNNEQQKEGVNLANKIAEQPVTQPEIDPITNATGKIAIPIESDILPDTKLTDVKDDGSVTIEDKDGNAEDLDQRQQQAAGVTDDHIQQFKDANNIVDKIPVPAPTPIDANDPKEGGSEFSHKLRTETDPAALAKMYADKVDDLQTNVDKEGAIASYGGRIKADDFNEHAGSKNVNRSIALNYFTKKGESALPIDTQVGEINGIHFNDTETVKPEDITDFMTKYPNGHNSYFTPSGNEELKAINDRYRELTGKNLRKDIARSMGDKYGVDHALADNKADEVNSTHAETTVENRIDDLVHRDGLFEGHPDGDRLNEELDRYIEDPSNEFNYWHEAFNGEKPNEHEIELTKNIIDEQTRNQGSSEGQAEEHPVGGENSSPQSETQNEGESGADDIAEGKESTEEELKQGEVPGVMANKGFEINRSPIDPETQEAVKKAMENIFPNVKTQYYDNVEDFNNAAKADGFNLKEGTVLHAFVDKNRVIHFNPDYMSKDVQLHEQGHILTSWAFHYAPKLFERMESAGRSMGDVQRYLRSVGYTEKGRWFHEEAFVTALGKEGENSLDELVKGKEQRSSLQRLIHEAWIKFERFLAGRTGFSISKFKNINDMGLDEFTKYVNEKYLSSDVKISDISSKELADKGKEGESASSASMSAERPAREPGEGMAAYASRVADWMDEQKAAAEQAKVDAEAKANELVSTETENGGDNIDNTLPPNDKGNNGKPGYNFDETSIKNETTTEERSARFLDKVEIAAKRDFGEVFDNAKKIVDDAIKNDPSGTLQRPGIALAESIIKDPRPLRAEESAVLLYTRMQLYNAHRNVMDSIDEAIETGNEAAKTQGYVNLVTIENNINNNDIASRLAGYEQGLGLAARQMMIKEDYSLANQQQQYKIANAGKDLPPEVKAQLESLTKQLEEANQKLEAAQTKNSGSEFAKSLIRLKKEVDAQKLDERKQKRQKTSEQIEKNIKDLKSSIYDKLTRNKGMQSNVGGPLGDAFVRLTEITPDLISLTKEYIHAGINTVDGIVDQLHSDLKDHLDGISKRDIRDAISGYGKNSKLSQDDVDVQLRELKRQSRLISALEDAQNGERPLRSGLEREAPSDKVRELQKEVYRTMVENGIPINPAKVSEEDAWKSALDAVKTRLKNQIKDLSKQLETGEKSPDKVGIKYDQEANDLKAERDRLKSAVDAVTGKPDIAPEHLIAIAKGVLERNIAEYERRIKEVDLNPKKSESKTPETPELTGLRSRLAELQDTYKKMQDDAKPKFTPEERALDAFKKRNEKKAAELQDKIDNKDYDVAKKGAPIALDDEAKQLQTKVNLLKRKIDEGREELRLKNRNGLQKFFDWTAKYRKFALLDNVTTVAKLTAAGAMRMISSPLEEIAGHGLTLVPGISKISEKAPREGGGISISAEARSLTESLSIRSLKEMGRVVKEGRSELDERVNSDEKVHPRSGILDLPGLIHSSLKTIPKQGEYYRSLQKRIDYALKNGFDISNPDAQTSIQMENYKNQYPDLFSGKSIQMSDIEHAASNDSKRAIFMQDNILATSWQKFIKADPKDGVKGQVKEFIGKLLIPIIKIPSNFVAEGISYIPGGGALKGIVALRHGIDNLTPDKADYVMRAFKKQSIGAGFFALGYFLPQAIGGYYTEKEKRGWNEPEAGDVDLFGHPVPHWLMHSPILEVMQMGATIRRTHDQYVADSNGNPDEDAPTEDIGKGLMGIGKGYFGQIPLFGEAGDIAHAVESYKSLGKFSAQFLLGLTVPYDVQRVAKYIDKDSYGDEIKRNPQGFEQTIKAAIPIWRESVPEK